MSCLLRFSGRKFDPEHFIKVTGLKASVVYFKGEPRVKTKPHGKKFTESGLNLVVSNAELNEFKKQIKDSIRYLRKHKGKLDLYLKSDKSLDLFVLDFGISRRDNVIVQCDEFPAELLMLAGSLGISIQLSQYPK